MQRKAVAAPQVALQALLFALRRPANREHCRADLVLFQQADVFVQPVQHISRHRLAGIRNTFRVREFLDIHGEHGVLSSVLHDSLSVFYSAGTALSILLHPHRKVNRKAPLVTVKKLSDRKFRREEKSNPSFFDFENQKTRALCALRAHLWCVLASCAEFDASRSITRRSGQNCKIILQRLILQFCRQLVKKSKRTFLTS